jgi:hypothetical protein
MGATVLVSTLARAQVAETNPMVCCEYQSTVGTFYELTNANNCVSELPGVTATRLTMPNDNCKSVCCYGVIDTEGHVGYHQTLQGNCVGAVVDPSDCEAAPPP